MKLFRSLLYYTTILLALSNCAETHDTSKEDKKIFLDSISTITALPKVIKAPKNNPMTPQKVALGKLLFFDPILSGGKDVACATCHHPQHGYAEFLDISIGVNGQGLGSKRAFNEPNDIPFVKRNAHTILNTAFNGINIHNEYTAEEAPMFWDNRVVSLEKQALEPIKSFEEMRGHEVSLENILPTIVHRLQAIPEYQNLFDHAFDDQQTITAENISKAIASFERTLITNNSRFDQYMRGDNEAISLSEKEGFQLFKQVGCANCHSGPMFSDFKPHVLGVLENHKLSKPDAGFNDAFAFRTPTLRNLRFTAPYMHNGTFSTLEKVLEFYEDISVGKLKDTPVKVSALDTLVNEITIEVKDMSSIISFLNCLNDTNFDKTIPKSVPSGLSVGGDI